jgi:hypothetical protein
MAKYPFVLCIAFLLFQEHALFSQTNRFQSYWEINSATKPINRHIFEVDVDQSFSGDSANSFTGGLSSMGLNLWYFYYPTRSMKLNFGAYWNESLGRPDLNQNPESELRLSGGPSFNVPGRRVLMNHRFMADYRMFFIPDAFKHNWRLRYRFQAMVPLNKRTLIKNTVYVFGREEFFFAKKQLNDGIQLLNMARTVFGLGYVFSDYVQVEVIYQYGIVPYRGDKSLAYRDHFLGLSLQFNNLFLKPEE